MLVLKKYNTDIEKEWAFVRDMPEDENGLTNPYHGCTLSEYEEIVLPEMLSHEKPIRKPDWFVPATYYYLWDEGRLLGEFRLRHYLTDTLRSGAGHVGYSIRKEDRGKGFATEGLRLLIPIASMIVPEEEIYLRVHKSNIASQKVMQNNGARFAGEAAGHMFFRIQKQI